MNPKISVIVPVHNTEKYLEQCLETIINQTFKDTEIICVDDGSTDSSREILEQFARSDNRIRLICRETASGSAALPRNLGLEDARGKYVMFLDSDDYFDVEMLEKLYNRAEETAADFVMCDNYRVLPQTGELSEEGTELKKEYLPEKEVFSYKDIPEAIFQISTASAWHKLIRKELLDKEGLKYQLDTPSLDDVYFVNMLLVLAKRISTIEERLIFYRVLRQGAQTSVIEKHKESIFSAFCELNKSLKEKEIYEEVKASLQKWTLGTMSWWLKSISNYTIYAELCDLYRNEYFEKLGLLEIDWESLNDPWSKDFYDSIMNMDFRPPLKMVLETFLEDRSRIAIYGAGGVGKNIYSLVENQGKHNIVLWCDRNAERIEDSRVSKPEALLSEEFDAVFIAIGDRTIAGEVKLYLLEMGIPEKKIFNV